MSKRIILCGLLFISPSVFADTANMWNNLSNILGYGMPLVAAGYSIDREDERGFVQLSASVGTAYGTSLILKNKFPEDRPDGSGNDSFPSAHSALAFSSARYLTKRYDDMNPYILYGSAVLTGVARVQANQHSWGDVIFGSALGYLSSELWTSSKDRSLAVFPQPNGIAISYRQQF